MNNCMNHSNSYPLQNDLLLFEHEEVKYQIPIVITRKEIYVDKITSISQQTVNCEPSNGPFLKGLELKPSNKTFLWPHSLHCASGLSQSSLKVIFKIYDAYDRVEIQG